MTHWQRFDCEYTTNNSARFFFFLFFTLHISIFCSWFRGQCGWCWGIATKRTEFRNCHLKSNNGNFAFLSPHFEAVFASCVNTFFEYWHLSSPRRFSVWPMFKNFSFHSHYRSICSSTWKCAKKKNQRHLDKLEKCSTRVEWQEKFSSSSRWMGVTPSRMYGAH